MLVLIGFKESDFVKYGLCDVLVGDLVVVIEGGYIYVGGEKVFLDEVGFLIWLIEYGDGVLGFVVVG